VNSVGTAVLRRLYHSNACKARLERCVWMVPLHVHRVAAVSKVEVLLLLLGVGGTEAEVALLVDLRTSLGHVLSLALLIREVLLDDVVGLHVDLLVGVVLALVDLLHTADLLNEESVAVDGLTTSAVLARLLVHLTNLEDVLEAIKSDLDDLVVRACEQVAEGLDAAALDEVADLSRLLQTTAGGVGDGPASFLPGLEVAVLEKVNQRGNDVCVNDSLDLCRVAGSDVRDGPAGLLADTVLSGAQQGEQSGQRTAVDDDLGLDVITGNDVANGSEGGCLDRGGSVHEQLYEATGNAGLDDSLDLVVGTIRKVGDGPAGIDEDFVIERVDELGENGKSGLDLKDVSEWWKMQCMDAYRLPVRLGSLSTAEIAECPGGVPEHAQLAAVTEKSKQRAEGTGSKNEVAARGAITGNVTKGPNSLLPDIRLVAAKKLDEDGDGACLNDDLCLLGGARGDVGKSPCGLKLDKCVGRAQELYKAADDTGLDDPLDGRVAFLGQELAELGRGLDLLIDLLGEDALDHLGEVLVQLAGQVSVAPSHARVLDGGVYTPAPRCCRPHRRCRERRRARHRAGRGQQYHGALRGSPLAWPYGSRPAAPRGGGGARRA
jgi:hypothetical protein